MLARCYNQKNPKYSIYGGKGIKVCDEWINDYDCFKNWSYNNGYFEGCNLSIDRIDSNQDYSPDNCQWISLSLNSAKANYGRHKNKSKKGVCCAYNTETNINYEFINISKFCREHNLSRGCVSHRLNNIIKNNVYKNWIFYRKEDKKSLTTIETINA